MKVCIVGGSVAYAAMYLARGYEVVDTIEESDFVQFTGGADVSPHLYGEAKHPLTGIDPQRDMREQKIHNMCINLNKPMVGICRGAQFLNVMSGGKMFQDVRGHAIQGTHEAIDIATGKGYQVTSTHHQMMRCGEHGALLAYADHIGKNKQYMDGLYVVELIGKEQDAEAIWYENTNSLCFQPHPEYGDFFDDCTNMFFMYVETYIHPLCK